MLDRVAENYERYLDLLSLRQKLAASNIANADTPGYKTKDIDFQFEFLSRVEGSQPHVIEPDLPANNDGNNVSLDRESRMLAENATRFQLVSLLARGQIRRVQSAIQEGRNG